MKYEDQPHKPDNDKKKKKPSEHKIVRTAVGCAHQPKLDVGGKENFLNQPKNYQVNYYTALNSLV